MKLSLFYVKVLRFGNILSGGLEGGLPEVQSVFRFNNGPLLQNFCPKYLHTLVLYSCLDPKRFLFVISHPIDIYLVHSLKMPFVEAKVTFFRPNQLSIFQDKSVMAHPPSGSGSPQRPYQGVRAEGAPQRLRNPWGTTTSTKVLVEH